MLLDHKDFSRARRMPQGVTKLMEHQSFVNERKNPFKANLAAEHMLLGKA